MVPASITSAIKKIPLVNIKKVIYFNMSRIDSSFSKISK